MFEIILQTFFLLAIDPSRLRPQQQSAGGGGGGPLAYQLGGQQQGSLLSDIDKNIIYFNAMNPVVQLQRRKKRQTSWPQTSSSLQGTAYEGQDRQFIRQPIDLSQYQLNPQYKYYDQLPMSFGKTTTMEGGVSTFERNHPQPQYYPYGTAVENDNLSGPQNQQNLANQQQNLLANTQNQQQQNFAASHQNQQNWPGLQSRWDQRREMASGQAASRPIKPRGFRFNCDRQFFKDSSFYSV